MGAPTATPSALEFEDWHDQVCRLVPLKAGCADDAAAFAGTVESTTLGSVLLTTVSASEGFVERTRRQIRSDDVAVYKFGLQVGGTCVLEQDGRQAFLKPGDLAIYDTSRPYRISLAEDFRMTVAIFSRELVQLPRADLAEATAVRFPGSTGMFSLVAPLLAGLGRDVGPATTFTANHLGDAVVDLTTAAFAQLMQRSVDGESSASQRALLAGATKFIDEHLHDPDLSTQLIADAHFVSTRHLQKVFESQGTSVAARIRTRRLERCRHDLTAPQQRHVPIAAIGRRWGFSDAAHFSRLFRSTYGRSPREYRRDSVLAE
ncbi:MULTISPECIES: helix-turn-helix domain-containing protein [unclassified Amycolatopsis]|uniref:AraC-like ligand-binding domain-containing protein n=1 Tax=unclassified Amycolatopsis TaxID=2618356 RepID=UPI001C6982E8|nr:helix-turn-helix domain-containing protein [Amycolatopsis sp. DSM 110486]QYN21328.1 helix-turn-helix domain-containing protein [Amycolatopsis sp. DSM 110486]